MTLEQIPHFDLNSQPLLAAGAQVEIPPEENFVQTKDCLHQCHRYASLIFCPLSPVKHVYLLLFLIAVRDIPSKHNSPSSLLLPNAFQCLPNALKYLPNALQCFSMLAQCLPLTSFHYLPYPDPPPPTPPPL